MDRRTALSTLAATAVGGCLDLRSDPSPSSTEPGTGTAKPTPTETATRIDSELSLRSSWARSFPSERDTYVDGDRLYTPVRGERGGADGVRAVAVDSGETLWTAALESSPNFMYATVADDRLYITAGETLYAVDTADGAVLGRRDLGDTRGSPAVADGTVVVGTTFEDENALYGLDADTLEERWRVGHRLPLGDSRYAPSSFDGAVAAGGRVVAAYRNGRFSAYDPANGTEQWVTEFVTAGPSYGPFADGSGGVLAIESEELVVARLDPATGERRWAFGFETRTGALPPVARPVVAGETGYVGVERNLIAFDPETGERRWHVELSDPVSDGRVGLTDEAVWIATGDDDQAWHGYDRADGRGRYLNRDPPLSAQFVGDGAALVASGRSKLERFAVSGAP